MRRPRVLIVDDNRANLLALEAVLDRDYDLLRAESGAEAIGLVAASHDIDLILLDVHMPEMDGFEAAARIKKMDGGAEIPIIFITAVYNDDPYVRRGYEVGGIDYFSKPFDPDILRTKVGIYSAHRQRAAVLETRERQLRESEELLRVGRRLSAVLERLPVGVLIADIDGGICQATEEVARILRSDEPPESDAYAGILGWWDSDGRMLKDPGGPLARALQDGASANNTPVEIRCLDGSTKTILMSAAPLLGRERRILGAVILLQDITQRKEIERDLEQRVAKLVSLGVELDAVRTD